MKRGVKCASSLVIAVALFLMPVSSAKVYASETDKNFWAMWWLEQKTGVDWSKYTGMDAGMTYGEYVYRQTGRTVDYAVDTVCNGVSYDTTKQFVYNTVEDTRQTAKDMYNNMPGYPGVVQDFLDEKVWRVDGDGNVNVSGSDFWSSVYNDLFGDSGSTKDVYEQSAGEGYQGTSNNMPYSISVICPTGQQINTQVSGFYGDVFEQYYWSALRDTPNVYSCILVITDNGHTGYINIANNNYYSYTAQITTCEINGQYLNVDVTYYRADGDVYPTRVNLKFRYSTSENPNQNQGAPVLQPSQVGFAIDPYTGIRYPIYTPYNPDSGNPAPPDDLPYTTNPDGTVTWTNPNPDPEHPENDRQDTDIWIDPGELTDDGWYLFLKWLTDNGYGTGTGGGYNGDGKNYNLDSLGDNATLVDIIKAGFKDLLNKINPFGDLINTIKNALSQMFSIDLSAFNSQEFEIDEDFDIITAIWEKLLELMGVQ